MKILHVCKKYPPALGGDAIVVSNLARQQQANHSVIIVTSNCQIIAEGPHIYKLGLKDTPSGLDTITLKRIISLVIIFFRMFAILRKERPDIIHTHSVDMAFFASFAARFFHIPIIHTFHIVTFYDTHQSVLRRKSELWLLQKAQPHFVTAPNNYDVQKLRSAGVGQAILLPNGVDLTFWKPSLKSQTNQPFTFLAVGRLENQKGYDYLIKAVSLLRKKTAKTFRLVIVGEGSQKKALRELAQKLHVDNIVEFSGSKTQKQIRTLLKKTDAMICPSLYETTPLTLLEAWATKTPIIISRVGLVRDAPISFKAALVVPPKDVESLANAMEQYLTNTTKRLNAAAQGYREVQKFAWPNIAKTAEEIYQGVG